MRRNSLLLGLVIACSVAALAAEYQRGALVREATIYLSPDVKSAKIGEILRGQEVIVLDAGRGWLHASAELGEEKTITGWVLDKGVVRKDTPNGDQILYGEAVDSEDQASRRRGRKGADKDAMRLYYRVYEYFPDAPLAGAALYRAADIRWQVDREDVFSRPSGKERDSGLRGQIDDSWMKLVMKKYPTSKWADLAAFHLLDNKVCGDWQGSSKCPDKEADLYEKYATERPQSPVVPEAIYNAAWRRAAMVDMLKTEEQPGKAVEARKRSMDLCQRLLQAYPQSDFAPRAQRLFFLLQQEIPVYGNVQD